MVYNVFENFRTTESFTLNTLHRLRHLLYVEPLRSFVLYLKAVLFAYTAQLLVLPSARRVFSFFAAVNARPFWWMCTLTYSNPLLTDFRYASY